MTRGKLAVIAVAAVVVLGLAAVYLVRARSLATAELDGSGPSTGGTLDAGQVLASPHVVFRDSELGANYGRLAAVPLTDPEGPRALFPLTCERSYAVASAAVCITAKRGVVQTFGISMLDADLQTRSTGTLVGLPSRARMSRDGSLVATTTFVTGHSYAQGSFATETIIRRNGTSVGNLEKWDVQVDGRRLKAVDLNLWGVTFAADGDTVFVTAAWGGTTRLMKGSISARTLTSIQRDAECPSLSPDGSKVAYKKRLGSSKPGVWRIAVLDLATMQETLTADTRSVDDQVEWLDDTHLLYALPRPGSEATVTDIWQVAADGSGEARVFIERGSSPAVVRS